MCMAVGARQGTLRCRRLNTVDRLPDGQFSSASKGLLLQLANGWFHGRGVAGYEPPYRLDVVLTTEDDEVLTLFAFRRSGPVERLALRIETDADVADLFVRMGGQLAGTSADAKLSESYRGMLDATQDQPTIRLATDCHRVLAKFSPRT